MIRFLLQAKYLLVKAIRIKIANDKLAEKQIGHQSK